MEMSADRHVVGLSGGRDSAALAIFMRQHYPEIDVEYFFTDTGKELPEVYEFLVRLEGFLGKPIRRLNPQRGFDFWLAQYKHFLPSAKTRWCTRQLKIEPFEAWLRPDLEAGLKINSYVAIRADEPNRSGHLSTKAGLQTLFPLREHGVDLQGVKELLETSGVGLPGYYRWRSRSGCTFCFFQQRIEWVRLREEHPEAFEEAKRYEKLAKDHSSPFTWVQGESLEDLEQPERIDEIRKRHSLRMARLGSSQRLGPLQEAIRESELLERSSEAGCLACHK